MKNKTSNRGEATPTVNVSVAKNRLKVYNKESQLPTIYLEKDAEFEIELFNPTKDVIVAEIILNDKAISQGGLVLRQGERIFLERYLDVAKKFRFETYTVSNTEEVQAAIKDNGSLKVKFYREDTTPKYVTPKSNITDWTPRLYGNNYDSPFGYVHNSSTDDVHTMLSGSLSDTLSFTNINASIDDDVIGFTSSVQYSAQEIPVLDAEDFIEKHPEFGRDLRKKSKKTETGRVSEGSTSSQEFANSEREFHPYPFATVTYKLMPVSTKQVDASEVGKRRYCTNCGSKAKSTFKFCPTCGDKV